MPSCGIVIGTFDSLGPNGVRHGVPSVELNLAVIRRRCGATPVLVVDDASPAVSQLALRAICARYGATFLGNTQRLGHTSGDIAVFGYGLRWASEHGITVLTKLSQRMIFDVPNWVQEDADLLLSSGYGTMTAALSNFGDPTRVRTEAVMMVVARWMRPQILQRYQPGRYLAWNEGHTADTIRQYVDPHQPFPNYLPWPRLRAIRGQDVPPVYFRQMPEADRRFQELARQYGVKWPAQLQLVDSTATRDYHP